VGEYPYNHQLISFIAYYVVPIRRNEVVPLPPLILYMNKSTITIDVMTDENKVPDSISWSASDTTTDTAQKAKAMMISFWDGAEKAALRIDLWTKDMMVDEMADFFYQTMMTMADTYGRATQYTEQVEEMKKFSRDFYDKFRAKQLKENKAD
jgi:gliding motility-associated protein GldC